MDVYNDECSEILRRFLERRISHSQCLAALDAALSDAVLRLDPENLRAVQDMIRFNYDVIAAEMKRRGPSKTN
jgi:hypothetical protein